MAACETNGVNRGTNRTRHTKLNRTTNKKQAQAGNEGQGTKQTSKGQGRNKHKKIADPLQRGLTRKKVERKKRTHPHTRQNKQAVKADCDSAILDHDIWA